MYALGGVRIKTALWKRLSEFLSVLDGRNWDHRIAKAEQEGRDLELPDLSRYDGPAPFMQHLSHHVSKTYVETI